MQEQQECTAECTEADTGAGTGAVQAPAPKRKKAPFDGVRVRAWASVPREGKRRITTVSVPAKLFAVLVELGGSTQAAHAALLLASFELRFCRARSRSWLVREAALVTLRRRAAKAAADKAKAEAAAGGAL